MAKYPIPQPIIDNIEELENIDSTNSVFPFYSQDTPCVIDFLRQYSGNKATFEAYRREVERLLQWSWLIAEKSILVLKRADIETYIAFCLKPPKSWIGLKRVSRFVTRGGKRIQNKHWRPFVATVSKEEHKKGIIPDRDQYKLSQKALREIFTILGSFYNYFVLDEKIPSNPVALIRQKSKFLQKRQQKATVMRLSEVQWQMCLDTAREMAEEHPTLHERTLFMISALYLLYLRVSELAASERWTPQMRHFYKDTNNQWWFKTVGKGNKMREIAVSDDMLEALKRYRISRGLSSLPSAKDKSPLIPNERTSEALTSTRRIRSLIQSCFDSAIEKLQTKNLLEEANALESATVHWLRHTGISDDINKRGRPVAHVRDDAGHSSSSITDRYNDIELTERHESAKHKKADWTSGRIETETYGFESNCNLYR